MELVNIKYTGQGYSYQDLSVIDKPLVVSNYINSSFGQADDYLELYIYDQLGNILLVDYDASDYYPSILNNPKNNTYSSLNLDPEKDLKNRGFNRGSLVTQYNFYKNLFNSSVTRRYWIKEISTSRTELKLSSQIISDSSILNGVDAFQTYIARKNYYPVFYLNFGDNKTIIANNVAYTEDAEGVYLLIKLYQPLPAEFGIKTQLWIVDKVADSVSFNVDISVEVDEIQDLNRLKGPNYNVPVNNRTGQTTPYYNYNNLLSSPITSSFQKLASFYQDKAVQINVDYSDFSNFVHFSSAVERVSNFVYKLQLIESASANIAAQQAVVGGSLYPSQSISREQQAIDNIIKNFDIYEYFLYFQSSSWAWPKSNTTQPYQLYSTTSSQAVNFLGGINTIPTATTQSLLWSASYYDATNKDLFHNSIPQYLLDDPSNQPYVTFLDMIGQHFDNIWVYYKDVSNRFNATNNPDTGISLDIVSDALRGLGFQLFTNTNVSDNLYYTLFGINPDGSLLPPTGSELITNYVTSSLNTLPAETIQDEIYKRLYHNLPYLYKTKGTARSIKSIISIYGIPEDILTVREFGGNFTGSLDGVIDLNSSDYKIAIVTGSGGNVTGSATISSSLLSPYTTIQYYAGANRINSTNLEVGFSPSDVVNNNITASLSIFNIDQLIGSPGYQYSSSYTPLVSASNSYFSSYTQPNSIWEYIRLLKFYNNSLFKVIKTFVPARANISTGIIIKSHMLERNKYARHEPQITFNDYSQSIEMLTVTGSEGGALTYSTAWSGFVNTPLGWASYSSSAGIEKFNGELSGSEIIATDGQALEQGDYISHITGAIDTYNYGGLYQNVTSSVKSGFLFDLDYNSDQIIPINYNAVTYSISQSRVNSYSTFANPNNPIAQVQDYNYFLNRSIIPRYEGSKTISTEYNTYTDGDQSYGKTAAIDKIKYQYGYLVDVYTASKFLPNRSNAQIKYIIDNDQNVLDLTKTNKNIFQVQNIYKSGESADIALFQYDEQNPYSQQLANNPTVEIYEGGWRYLPILHNVNGTSTSQTFELPSPLAIQVPVIFGGGGLPPDSPYLVTSNYSLTLWVNEVYIGGINEQSNFTFYVSASYIGPSSPPTETIYLNVSPKLKSDGTCGSTSTTSITINSGQTDGSTSLFTITADYVNKSGGGGWSTFTSSPNHWPSAYSDCIPTINSITAGGGGGGGGTISYFTYYTTQVTSSQACIYYLSQSNEIVFSPELTYWYENINGGIIFSSSGDNGWSTSGLEPVVLPFSIGKGDKISIYNASSSLGWNELSEYTVNTIRITGSISTLTGSALLVKPVEEVNVALFQSGSGIPLESITGTPWRACRYIVWKHVPDETNVMLRYNPKSPSLVENGLLLPQYIDPVVREGSGNVIKALTQQNLI